MTSQTHLVVGATGSVGAALARLLHARGDHVVLAGRNADKLQSLAQELGAPSVVVDATDAASVDAAVAFAVDSAAARGARLDGAFNGVGSLLLKAAHQTRDDEYRAVFATHVDSSFFLVRACVKNMTAGGSIVLVSSAAARIGLANHDVIAAAKAAVEGLAIGAAATYAGKGIRINVVAPGLVRAGITERIFASDTALKSSIAMVRRQAGLVLLCIAASIAIALIFIVFAEPLYTARVSLYLDAAAGADASRSEVATAIDLDTHAETDDAVLQTGHVSATRIDIRTLGQHL